MHVSERREVQSGKVGKTKELKLQLQLRRFCSANDYW